MNDREVLALYDREQRIESPFPQEGWENLGHIVRAPGLFGDKGMVIYSCLEPDGVDAAIDEQIAYFEGLGQDFEWKVYGHDQPHDLRDRLTARGFEIGEPEALLICDLRHAPAALLKPVTHDIRPITDAANMDAIQTILETVWKEDMSTLAQRMASQLTDAPESLSLYAAYMDDHPASVAWISFDNGSFAGLWGGSTLPQHRNRGLYHALLAVRAQEALRRGKRFLTIDASPMSRPIVERQGFRFMTMIYPRLWRVGQKKD